MRKSTKKGFTIVELVIVVAVIAILAAVLIPTFTGIVKKARLSNDQSMIRNMNTTLAMESIPDSFKHAGDAVVALNMNGFEGKYNPYSSGYHYAYHLESNTMYLVDDNNEVVYPEDSDYTVADLWFLWSNRAVDKVEGATKYVSLVNIENGAYYKTHFGDGATYQLDLGDHYLNYSTDTLTNVTVRNGVLISGTSSTADDVITLTKAEADNVPANGTAEAPTLIENMVFTNADPLAGKANVTYKNCYFYDTKTSGIALKANVTFDGCTFIDAQSYIFNVQGDGDAYNGTLTVKNCEFINCARVFNIPVYVEGEGMVGGTINITGNTFHAVTGQNRVVIQLSTQKKNFESTNAPVELRDYVDITISNNKFTGIASTQAGLISLHESFITTTEVENSAKTEKIQATAGAIDATTDHITISGNTVDSSIPADKYVVNDDGKPDSDFDPYMAGDFKTALTNKFVAGKK